MIQPPQLREALRLLLLPARASSEEKCAEVLRLRFAQERVVEDDYLNWVKLHLGKWAETEKIPEQLSTALKEILLDADGASGKRTGDAYERLYRKLRTDHTLAHDECRAFLSHAFLIQDLATIDRLSAAQISKLLAQRDGRVRFSRQSVGDFLDILGIPPKLSERQLQELVYLDHSEEPAYFADADVAASAAIVADAASQLGFVGDFEALLRALYVETQPATFTPYLQILHYQCVIAEFFDHALTDLYEFAPRGAAAQWLFGQYPESMATAGNPFLNNAKSVERVSISWVRSKRVAERPGAAALLALLEGLEAMGFAARRELARSVRLWLHRMMRLSEPLLIQVPEAFDLPTWSRLLKAAANANTGTFGVLEQRIVDAAATWAFEEAGGWRARGVGASVNATNVSQRKIGDCDFQNSNLRQLKAFEAHGGNLSDIYVAEHLRTMRKIVPARAEELSGIADLSEWDGTVVFVAHTITAAAIAGPFVVSGLSISVQSKTYAEVVEQLLQDVTAEHLNRFILAPIREKRTPVEVRKAINLLAS